MKHHHLAKKGVSAMDIAALSTGMAQAKLMNSVGYAVLGNVLDSMESSGSQISALLDSAPAASSSLELSVNPHIGGNFDMSV